MSHINIDNLFWGTLAVVNVCAIIWILSLFGYFAWLVYG